MQKKKSGVKNVWKFVPLRGGGVGPLMANAIKNFHFDFLTTSLIKTSNDDLQFDGVDNCVYGDNVGNSAGYKFRGNDDIVG